KDCRAPSTGSYDSRNAGSQCSVRGWAAMVDACFRWPASHADWCGSYVLGGIPERSFFGDRYVSEGQVAGFRRKSEDDGVHSSEIVRQRGLPCNDANSSNSARLQPLRSFSRSTYRVEPPLDFSRAKTHRHLLRTHFLKSFRLARSRFGARGRRW